MISILEINAESALISVSKGFLVIKRDSTEEKVPLDNIESLIINAHGAMISNHAIMRLSEQNIPIIHCGQNAVPCSMTLSCGLNIYRKERIDMQLAASLPLKKNLWKQVIKAKILNQAKVLELNGRKHHDVARLIEKVASGDTGNMESVAARAYWERLFGKGFKRNPDLEGINSFLNYGYAILRASFCRNIVAGGLLPELGIHHINQKNPYCLADDLMEPLRPFIDLLISQMKITPDNALLPAHKRLLICILDLEMPFLEQKTHTRFLIPRVINLYIASLAEKKSGISYPVISNDTLVSIMAMIANYG